MTLGGTVPKYAVVERGRRFLVRSVPDGVTEVRRIVDRYVTGTRLRLREVHHADGRVERKLGQKVRLGAGAAEVACTNLYLDAVEWDVLLALPGRQLAKTRHLARRDGVLVAVDEHADGTLVAEIDDGDHDVAPVPDWLDVIEDVSGVEAWTGHALAQRWGRPGRSGGPERGATPLRPRRWRTSGPQRSSRS
jgi:CYTH domain-containing protein